MAQSASVQMGARANGLAYASGCVSDVWSLASNIAGIAKTGGTSAGVSYHAIPSFPYFNRMAAVFVVPMKGGVAGASAFRFGDDLYSEQILSLGFANTYGLASLGVRLNYIQYKAEGMETRGALTLGFGGIAELTPQLSCGAYIVNVNQPVINDLTGERVPTRLIASIAFKPSDNLFIATEVEKDLDYDPAWKTGMEYWFLQKLAFRTGFNLHPQAGFFGLGFKGRRLQFDYALQFDDPLGISHQVSLTCQFRKP